MSTSAQPDDDLCLCFHVSWRKVVNFVRVHRIRHASQLSECYGAGTGCGWCRKQLERLTKASMSSPVGGLDVEHWLREHGPSKFAHVEGRQQYIADGKGKPPSDPSHS